MQNRTPARPVGGGHHAVAIASGVPSRAYGAAVADRRSTTPTFSWPWMIGNGVGALSVPAYCSVSPRNVCLSVPQIPEASIRSSTAPGSSSVGIGVVADLELPGAEAASPLERRSYLVWYTIGMPAAVRVGVIGTGIMGADHARTLHRTVGGATVVRGGGRRPLAGRGARRRAGRLRFSTMPRR